MKQPMKYWGSYPRSWAGYVFKEKLGYTTGVHTGVDYNHGTDDKGDPIYAIASGKVVAKVPSGRVGGFGNAFIIETEGTPPGVKGSKLYHRYLHCDKIHVGVGQRVREGQVVATVGTSGGVPAHLHIDTWTDRNGLKAHWNYHKNTQLSSYEDPYYLIKNNPNWDEAGDDTMDTDAKVKAQYYTLRGNEGTSSERKAWIGKSYEQFNATARPEVQKRTARIKSLESSIKTLTRQRDEARKEVATLTKQVLAERDKVKTLEAEVEEQNAQLIGAKEAYKELETMHTEKIAELNRVIEINNKELTRLSNELKVCQNNSGDNAEQTGWELIVLGLKKLFERSK